MPTVSYGITNTADDVADYTAAGIGVQDGEALNGFDNPNNYYVGFRFLGVVPAGTDDIDVATLTLTRRFSNSGTAWGYIHAVLIGSAPPWATTRPGLATKSIARVPIVDGAVQNYDVTALLQEIMSLRAPGDAIAFVGSADGANGTAAWQDYSSSAAQAAQLSITYTAGGPDVTPPTITSPSTVNAIEGTAASLTLTASEGVTWSISGGADQARFSLSAPILTLPAQDYLSPADANADNTYVVQVRATDGAGNTTDQTVTFPVAQAPMVRFIGAATGTTSATPPTHQPGDLIVAFPFRDGSATLPTLPTGQDWTSVLSPTGANTCSMRLAAKIADSSSEATGTFTSATSLIVHVYRPRPGVTLSIGAAASASGASTTVSFPALALQDPSGNSYVAGFAGSRSVNTTLESPPTGMVNRSTVVDATDEAAGHDTNGGVTSWPLTTKAVGGTSSGWWGATVEIKATGSAPAAKPFARSFLIG